MARKRAMSWPVWERKYKPIKNWIDKNSSYDGYMFETYGKEVKEVNKAPNNQVWTLIDGDGRKCYIIPGRHFVNRIGYFITEKSWTESDDEDGLSILA